MTNQGMLACLFHIFRVKVYNRILIVLSRDLDFGCNFTTWADWRLGIPCLAP